MIDEVNEFLDLYQVNGAYITDTIVSAETVIRKFIQDTARIAFLPRPLTQMEKDQVKTISADLHELIVAYDGIVAVVHPKNKIVEMTTTTIQKILLGTLTQWEQIVKPMRARLDLLSGFIGCHRISRHRLLKQASISAKLTRTRSDLQTLRLVEKDPYALAS